VASSTTPAIRTQTLKEGTAEIYPPSIAVTRRKPGGVQERKEVRKVKVGNRAASCEDDHDYNPHCYAPANRGTHCAVNSALHEVGKRRASFLIRHISSVETDNVTCPFCAAAGRAVPVY
jgi:hypothetical protein